MATFHYRRLLGNEELDPQSPLKMLENVWLTSAETRKLEICQDKSLGAWGWNERRKHGSRILGYKMVQAQNEKLQLGFGIDFNGIPKWAFKSWFNEVVLATWTPSKSLHQGHAAFMEASWNLLNQCITVCSWFSPGPAALGLSELGPQWWCLGGDVFHFFSICCAQQFLPNSGCRLGPVTKLQNKTQRRSKEQMHTVLHTITSYDIIWHITQTCGEYVQSLSMQCTKKFPCDGDTLQSLQWQSLATVAPEAAWLSESHGWCHFSTSPFAIPAIMAMGIRPNWRFY